MGKRVKEEGVSILSCENPLTMLKKINFIEYGTRFKTWLVKHSFEDASSILISAIAGGSIAAIPCAFNPRTAQHVALYPMTPMFPVIFKGTTIEQARNVAFMSGVYTGISNAMERVRGKEDIRSNLVAGFGAGVIVSLVCGINGTDALSAGVFGALFYVARFKVNEKSSKPQVEPILYKKTRDMLSSLGLDHYEKNFKKGHLTDKTLPLLNDRETDAEKGGTRREI